MSSTPSVSGFFSPEARVAAEQAYRFCEVAVEVRTAVSAEGYTPALSWAAGYVPAPAWVEAVAGFPVLVAAHRPVPALAA